MPVAFFDFLDGNPRYGGNSVERLNKRYNFLIQQFQSEIVGARILDLAAHDGRWSYALAKTGAIEVHGIEGRAELIEQFAEMPQDEAAARVCLQQGDIFKGLQSLVEQGATYDVVAAYGIYYHIMDHFLLLKLIMDLKPKLIIIDSEFIMSNNPMVQMMRERTDNRLNAIEQHEGQQVAIIGVPSVGAMEAMAEAMGWSCEWSSWYELPETDRAGIQDYFRDGKKCRQTCALRPQRRS